MRTRPRREQRLAWAGPVAGGAFLAGVLAPVVRSGQPYPRPGSTPDQIEQYFSQSSRAPWISITGQYLSASADPAAPAVARAGVADPRWPIPGPGRHRDRGGTARRGPSELTTVVG